MSFNFFYCFERMNLRCSLVLFLILVSFLIFELKAQSPSNNDNSEEEEEENNGEKNDDDEDDEEDEENEEEDDLNLVLDDSSSNHTNMTDYDEDVQIEHVDDLVILRTLLLKDTDRRVRPVLDAMKPVHVFMGVRIMQINSLDEVFQVMTITLQISLRWTSEFLTWNSQLFRESMRFKYCLLYTSRRG